MTTRTKKFKETDNTPFGEGFDVWDFLNPNYYRNWNRLDIQLQEFYIGLRRSPFDIDYNKIDKKIRPLIKSLNENLVFTNNCCEGHGNIPYIQFVSPLTPKQKRDAVSLGLGLEEEAIQCVYGYNMSFDKFEEAVIKVFL